ncbi:Hypothetical predicted protein [Podarcis lilfordi]|uniref:Uncharacterized protein n=1 Tax=Podarcis lilfordi TaxID=74358 RepID=A0AA35KSZ0_9SAUR|nr:Hypothetical predicted protein [Podarcis lilfordi]
MREGGGSVPPGRGGAAAAAVEGRSYRFIERGEEKRNRSNCPLCLLNRAGGNALDQPVPPLALFLDLLCHARARFLLILQSVGAESAAGGGGVRRGGEKGSRARDWTLRVLKRLLVTQRSERLGRAFQSASGASPPPPPRAPKAATERSKNAPPRRVLRGGAVLSLLSARWKQPFIFSLSSFSFRDRPLARGIRAAVVAIPFTPPPRSLFSSPSLLLPEPFLPQSPAAMEGVGALLAGCPTAGLAGGLGVTVCAAAGGVLLYKIARRMEITTSRSQLSTWSI